MTEQPPDQTAPGTDPDGLPDDVGADTTTPDAGDPQPFPDSDQQDGDDGTGAE